MIVGDPYQPPVEDTSDRLLQEELHLSFEGYPRTMSPSPSLQRRISSIPTPPWQKKSQPRVLLPTPTSSAQLTATTATHTSGNHGNIH